MKIIDKYFKRPLIWDIALGLVLSAAFYAAITNKLLHYPDSNFITTSLSDITNISFNSTGFILTILTVLITFKANSKRQSSLNQYDSAFNAFFESPLYPQTTDFLKNCIKSLITIGLIGFLAKISTPPSYTHYLYFLLILFLMILALTLLRCLMILNKILELQNK